MKVVPGLVYFDAFLGSVEIVVGVSKNEVSVRKCGINNIIYRFSLEFLRGELETEYTILGKIDEELMNLLQEV